VSDFRLFLNEACQGVLFLFVEVSKPFLFASHETAGASGYDVMKAARPAVQLCWPYQPVDRMEQIDLRPHFVSAACVRDCRPSKKEHGKEHYDEHDAPGKGKTFCPVRQIELAEFEVGGWMIQAVDGPTAEVWPLLLSDQYRNEVENAMSSAFIAPTKQTDNMSIM
jgi:hypothetical protein